MIGWEIRAPCYESDIHKQPEQSAAVLEGHAVPALCKWLVCAETVLGFLVCACGRRHHLRAPTMWPPMKAFLYGMDGCWASAVLPGSCMGSAGCPVPMGTCLLLWGSPFDTALPAAICDAELLRIHHHSCYIPTACDRCCKAAACAQRAACCPRAPASCIGICPLTL